MQFLTLKTNSDIYSSSNVVLVIPFKRIQRQEKLIFATHNNQDCFCVATIFGNIYPQHAKLIIKKEDKQ